MKPAILLAMLMLTACSGQKKPVQNSDTVLTLVTSDSYSGVENPKTLIIRDAESLEKFYAQINRIRKPGLPVPDIDFSKQMVVVRCSGITEGGAIPNLYLKRATKTEMVLGLREKEVPGTSSAITTPFSVYRMPVTAKEIVVKV
ncbi:MAG TPA: hypothetical protein VFM69_04840 [Pricia sp.]|nr:hypothetical protein [Pricia sp.]